MNTLNNILLQAITENLEKAKQYDEKIRLKAVTKRKIIYVFVFSILGLSSAYAPIIYLIWAALCILLVVKTTPEKMLIKLSKLSPDESFLDIIRKNNSPNYSSKEMISMALATLCAAASVFMLLKTNVEFKTEMEFQPFGKGYALRSYTQAFYDFSDNFTVPEFYENQPVVAIEKNAFNENSMLKKVTIPSSVTKIDSGAFKNCKNLIEVEIPDSVISIGAECFLNCSSLKSIKIPEGVTTIRAYCFENCTSLSDVVLHDKIFEIKAYAFKGCTSLENITLPKNIEEIKESTFENCSSLKSIVIPDSVDRIGAHAFRGCTSLSDVTVPESLSSIGSSAFRKCSSLNSILLPDTVIIDERAFKESPTRVEQKSFNLTTEEMFAMNISEFELIDKELSTMDSSEKIDPIYALFDEVDGIKIPDTSEISSTKSVLVRKNLQGFGWQIIDTKKEILSYLKMAKVLGAEKVTFLLDKERANLRSGTIAGWTYEIDEVIDGYSNGTWSFDGAYELYANQKKQAAY